jgi:hypothetical protein
MKMAPPRLTHTVSVVFEVIIWLTLVGLCMPMIRCDNNIGSESLLAFQQPKSESCEFDYCLPSLLQNEKNVCQSQSFQRMRSDHRGRNGQGISNRPLRNNENVRRTPAFQRRYWSVEGLSRPSCALKAVLLKASWWS